MKYDEIQVGDRVRVTMALGDAIRTVTGVVHSKRGGYLKTAKGYPLLVPNDPVAQFELLDRPTPGLPPSGTWVRFRPTYSNKWKIGQVQTSFSVSFVETLDNVYDHSEIAEFEEISWIAVTEG